MSLKHPGAYGNTIPAVGTPTTVASVAISPDLLVRAFQIHDFLKAANQSYPTEEAKSIVTEIVNERLRPAAVRNPTTRTTQRAQSADPPTYPPEWAVDRGRFTTDIRTFVVQYNRWKEQALVSRAGTVTPPHKPYSTGATPERAPGAPERERLSKEAFAFDFEGAINKLVLPSVEKPVLTARDNGTNSSNPSNSRTGATSNQSTSTPPSSTMPDANNFNGTGFTEQQWTALQTLINGSRNNSQGPQGERGERGEPGPPGNGSERWNPGEIGFFDPMYDGKSVITGNPIEHTGKDTYFRDVHLFIERIKDMAAIKSAEMVRNNLYTCLRGTALAWYTGVLTDDQKRLLKYGEGVNEWVLALLKRFKESPSTAMATVTKERYTLDDARRKREPFEFAQMIIRAAKSTGMTTYSQIYLIYNGIELEFRRDLTKPTESTTMEAFLQELEDNKEIWWDLGARHRGGYVAQSGSQRFSGFNNRPGNTFRPYQSQYDSGYRSGFGAMGTGSSATGARPAYQNTPPPRNQFPTSYQFRSPYPNYGAYSSQQQNRQPPPTGGAFPNPGGAYPQRNQAPVFPANRPQQSGNPGRPQSAPPPQNNQNAYGGQRQPFRPFTNYNNQNQPWRPSQSQSGQAQRAYHGETDENKDSSGQEGYEVQGDDDGNADPAGNEDNGEGYGEDFMDDSYSYHAQAGNDGRLSPDQEVAGYFLQTPRSRTRDTRCKRCNEGFSSRNKLHQHLRSCRVKPSAVNQHSTDVNHGAIIYSDAVTDCSEGLGFRSWHYATVDGSVAAVRNDGTVVEGEGEVKPEKITPDSGCTMSVIDRKFLFTQAPEAQVKTMPQPVRVRGIGDAMLDSSEYVNLQLSMQGFLNGTPVQARFRGQYHVVDGLKANLLLGSDILGPQRMVVDYNKEMLVLGCCRGMTVPMTVTPVKDKVKRVVRALGATVIPAHSSSLVPIRLRGTTELPAGRDFMFIPYQQTSTRFGPGGGVLSHMTDANMCAVQVNNATDKAVTIGKNSRLGTVQEYEEEGCYAASTEYSHLAAGSSWVKKTFRIGVGMLAAAAPVTSTPVMPIQEPSALTSEPIPFTGTSSSGTATPNPATTAPSPLSEQNECTIPNGITVYGITEEVRQQLTAVTEAYPLLWQDTGRTVDVPEEDWMPITLKPDAKIDAAKVYPLGPADREFVDKEFNKLHDQGRMEFTKQPTPFGWPVFVVWRTIEQPGRPPERKGRVVVDIRGLNKITVTDSYPLPLQSDITALVAGCRYITVVDAAGFFHQWLVKVSDRGKLTVVSHRGQEQFNVAAMGFKNSPPYVQRQIDGILRPHRDFARAYVDDIVIFSKTLEEHLDHLHIIFGLLDSKGITLSPKKSFLGYPTVTLLGQKVDAFGLTAAKDKIDAILRLDFPYKLSDLELYLGLTGWLRGYIPWYAQKAEALQRRKVTLLRMSPSNKGRTRKVYSQRTVIEHPDPDELDSYRQLQESFASAGFLVHFDRGRVLYIDVDASKQRGFGAMIYHLKPGADPEKPRRTDIEPILFLSRLLNSAETRYWPTELEMAGLVWVVKRVRHMIEAASKTVVYTDHAANPSIVRQTTLNSSSTDKLNLRLVRASTYLSQFQLDVRYRPGKQHIIPDALSRLPASSVTGALGSAIGALDIDTYHSGMEDPEQPDQVYAYQNTIIAMSPEFRDQILDGYAKEPSWRDILTMLKELTSRVANEEASNGSKPVRTGIDFKVVDGLIYYTGTNGRDRLCIPKSLEGEIFRQAHDENHHAGAHRCYSRISETLFIPKLLKKLRAYTEHCPSCQVNQTKRHAPYGELMPISTAPQPFHTIAMDFIVGLPGKYDCLLTITDKFSRRVLLIPGYSTDSAAAWARRVITRLQAADWGIPEGIISDRDPKFTSEFWGEVFRMLGTALLTSTAWHPQTDGQSERTNQTVEIALRYLITGNPDILWWQALPSLQAQLNNSPNAATGLSPNEIIYGFKVKEALSLLNTSGKPITEDLAQRRLEYRAEAAEATAFANAKAKVYYDARHIPLMMRPGVDKAYLKLNQGYQLPGKPNRKVSPQRCGPFPIKRRVGRLAYELDLPPNWRVHPVISIAQLEPDSTEDPYGRPRPDHPDAVEMEGDTPRWKSYEVERVTDKRYRNYNGKDVAQYLLRWKGYGPEWDVWRSITKLGNCMELVEEYENRQLNNQPATSRKSRRFRKTKSAMGTAKSAMGTPPSLPATSPPQQASSTVLTNPMVIIPRSGNPSASTPTITPVDSSLRRSERLRR